MAASLADRRALVTLQRCLTASERFLDAAVAQEPTEDLVANADANVAALWRQWRALQAVDGDQAMETRIEVLEDLAQCLRESLALTRREAEAEEVPAGERAAPAPSMEPKTARNRFQVADEALANEEHAKAELTDELGGMAELLKLRSLQMNQALKSQNASLGELEMAGAKNEVALMLRTEEAGEQLRRNRLTYCFSFLLLAGVVFTFMATFAIIRFGPRGGKAALGGKGTLTHTVRTLAGQARDAMGHLGRGEVVDALEDVKAAYEAVRDLELDPEADFDLDAGHEGQAWRRNSDGPPDPHGRDGTEEKEVEEDLPEDAEGGASQPQPAAEGESGIEIEVGADGMAMPEGGGIDAGVAAKEAADRPSAPDAMPEEAAELFFEEPGPDGASQGDREAEASGAEAAAMPDALSSETSPEAGWEAPSESFSPVDSLPEASEEEVPDPLAGVVLDALLVETVGHVVSAEPDNFRDDGAAEQAFETGLQGQEDPQPSGGEARDPEALVQARVGELEEPGQLFDDEDTASKAPMANDDSSEDGISEEIADESNGDEEGDEDLYGDAGGDVLEGAEARDPDMGANEEEDDEESEPLGAGKGGEVDGEDEDEDEDEEDFEDMEEYENSLYGDADTRAGDADQGQEGEDEGPGDFNTGSEDADDGDEGEEVESGDVETDEADGGVGETIEDEDEDEEEEEDEAEEENEDEEDVDDDSDDREAPEGEADGEDVRDGDDAGWDVEEEGTDLELEDDANAEEALGMEDEAEVRGDPAAEAEGEDAFGAGEAGGEAGGDASDDVGSVAEDAGEATSGPADEDAPAEDAPDAWGRDEL